MVQESILCGSMVALFHFYFIFWIEFWNQKASSRTYWHGSFNHFAFGRIGSAGLGSFLIQISCPPVNIFAWAVAT